jgi:zinc transport system permease protein
MFGKGFKKTALISVCLSVFSVVFGIILSYVLDLAPGGTIVLVSISTFLATLGINYVTKGEIIKKDIVTA